MAIITFDNYISRVVAGGIDENGMQFWNIIIVKVTGAHNQDDNRRWIEREEIVATNTIRCDSRNCAIDEGLRMAAHARAILHN